MCWLKMGLQGTFCIFGNTELWHLSPCRIEELSSVCISEAVTPAAWRSSMSSDEGSRAIILLWLVTTEKSENLVYLLKMA